MANEVKALLGALGEKRAQQRRDEDAAAKAAQRDTEDAKRRREKAVEDWNDAHHEILSFLDSMEHEFDTAEIDIQSSKAIEFEGDQPQVAKYVLSFSHDSKNVEPTFRAILDAYEDGRLIVSIVRSPSVIPQGEYRFKSADVGRDQAEEIIMGLLNAALRI